MNDVNLTYYQLFDIYNEQHYEDFVVFIDHNELVDDRTAIFKAQCELLTNEYVITEVNYPHIKCFKYCNLREEKE